VASKIHVVGLGVEPAGRLNANAEAALRGAEVIIGAERQLEWLRGMGAAGTNWPASAILPRLTELGAMIDSYSGEVAVLASGDPLYFGIGRWLGQRYPADQLQYHGALSSIQAACSRLGLALQDCSVLSLHGRPLGSLKRHLQAGRKLIILTDRHSGPAALARVCVDAGFDESRLWVCERLGYPDERIHELEVAGFADFEKTEFSDLQVSVLELRGRGGLMPSFAGLEDSALITDGAPGQGMISKRELRLQILSLLQVEENHVVWDVGAGCGGVSTELALWHPGARVFAIEQHPERLECLGANREKFGVFNLDIIAGRAPAALDKLPDPARVFIGGSDGELEPLLRLCWQRLAQDGLMVISAVTDDTRQFLETHAAGLGDVQAQVVRVAVARGSLHDGQWIYTDKRPVTLFQLRKTGPAL